MFQKRLMTNKPELPIFIACQKNFFSSPFNGY